ncbi:MAG: helix-turn-helix domain-containing protein [Phycisphaerales bacterium]
MRRLCFSQTGFPPMRYVTELRMRRAAAMLAGGRRKIMEVAAAVGYRNAFAFSTTFKRMMGKPPSQWAASAGHA